MDRSSNNKTVDLCLILTLDWLRILLRCTRQFLLSIPLETFLLSKLRRPHQILWSISSKFNGRLIYKNLELLLNRTKILETSTKASKTMFQSVSLKLYLQNKVPSLTSVNKKLLKKSKIVWLDNQWREPSLLRHALRWTQKKKRTTWRPRSNSSRLIASRGRLRRLWED